MKKIFAVMLVILSLFTAAVSVFAATKKVTFGYGNINGIDGINAEDARLCLRMALGIDDYKRIIDTYPTTAIDPERAADVDGDGKVTEADARLILRYATGLDKEFFPVATMEGMSDVENVTPKSNGKEINFWNLLDGFGGVFNADAFRELFNN